MEQTQERYQTLKNGAVYDHEIKRIVKGATLDTAQASAMSVRRQELKREALMRGAQRGTRDILQREPAHELEWVEVIGEANMHRAADPGNAKGVDAARMLLQETGLAEAKQAEAPNIAQSATAGALVQLVRMLETGDFGSVMSNYRNHETVDAVVTPLPDAPASLPDALGATQQHGPIAAGEASEEEGGG